jgi:hypothetical protein
MTAGTFVGERSFDKIITMTGEVASEPFTRKRAEDVATAMWNEFIEEEQAPLPHDAVVHVSDDEGETRVTVTVRYS